MAPWRPTPGTKRWIQDTSIIVYHHEINGSRLQHIAERREAVKVLAACDRGCDAAPDLSDAAVVVGDRDVLEPVQMIGLEPAADADRLIDAPALIDIAHELYIGADRLAYEANLFDFLARRCLSR